MEQAAAQQENSLQKRIRMLLFEYSKKGIVWGGGIRTIHTPLVQTGETRETQESCTPARQFLYTNEMIFVNKKILKKRIDTRNKPC